MLLPHSDDGIGCSIQPFDLYTATLKLVRRHYSPGRPSGWQHLPYRARKGLQILSQITKWSNITNAIQPTKIENHEGIYAYLPETWWIACQKRTKVVTFSKVYSVDIWGGQRGNHWHLEEVPDRGDPRQLGRALDHQ